MKKSKDFLNQRSDKMTIVLNDSGANLFKSAEYIVKQLRCNELLCIIYIACIKHDKDIDEETQHLKTTHYHLVIQFDRIYRLGTILDLISNTFHCNKNQITIDKCTSIIMQSRYLIHLDDFDKFQYNAYDVVSNRYDLFKQYLEYVKTISSVDDILALIKVYTRLDELMSHIGLENYKKYRVIINDLRREMFNY